ncbi:MAG: hypothetical protein ACLGHC_06365, partial [Alphaproteobacteria bacterium]
CDTETEPTAQNDGGPALNLPVPAPDPPLDRVALLAAVAEAASASAAGQPVPQALRNLDGREFELRIRFGCSGPSAKLAGQPLAWTYEAGTRRIRVRAAPTIDKDEPLPERIAGDQFESVEGFWIPRPWLLQPVCPAAAAVVRQPDEEAGDKAKAGAEEEGGSLGSDEPVAAAPRIGIAQFFTTSDSRTRRRDNRPYEAARTLAEDAPIPARGFDLVLSGRLRAIPGRGVIECIAKGPDSPPECIVSARFQRVWIEEAGSGDVYAEWGGG